MIQAEMTEHLGYEEYQCSDNSNFRNGKKSKIIHSKYGEVLIDVPQDRDGSFEPRVVKKNQKEIPTIDDKIISMYAKGMTTHQISEQIEDIYGYHINFPAIQIY